MKHSKSSRRNFLKGSALATLGATVAGVPTGKAVAADLSTEAVTLPSGIVIPGDDSVTRPRPADQKPVHDLTTQPLEKVRVAVIGLNRGMAHVDAALGIEFAEVVAVCDWREDRAKRAAAECEKRSGKAPAIYGGTEHIWEQMVQRDDIDAVYIATPWHWHVPMAVGAMEHGKHAFTEVPAAVTIEDCWQLVDASERTRRHCVLLENCCYGENELFVSTWPVKECSAN